MDLDSISALDELILGACLLLIPVPLLVLGAREGRRLLAAAPGVLSFILFALSFAHLHLASHAASEPIQWTYLIGAVLAIVLLLPSISSLRNRWLGLIHLATLAGILWSSFIGSLLLVRDSL